jgi:predicted nucleic acid-binding protein
VRDFTARKRGSILLDMKKASIYIETSIISYLTARPSRDLMIAAGQQVTAQWWETARGSYDVVTSDLVVLESREGDPRAAQRRFDLLRDIRAIELTDEARQLADILTAKGALPKRAQADALHIAVAAVHTVDYLLTWNLRHIDNPAIKPRVREICGLEGYRCPEICTPFEIMELR